MIIKIDIGLDAHKNSIVVATAKDDGIRPQHYGKWGGSNLCSQRGLVKRLHKFGLEKYEGAAFRQRPAAMKKHDFPEGDLKK